MTRKTDRYNIFILALIIMPLLASMGCTKHYANNVTQAKPEANVRPSKDVAKMLYGSWKFYKLELPPASDTSTASKSDRDTRSAILAKYSETLKELTITFKEDGTYAFAYGGRDDTGTWKVNAQNNVEGKSASMGMTVLFQDPTLVGNILTVKYDPGNGPMLISLIKQ